jgi:broad specificity phosphatase PhoE
MAETRFWMVRHATVAEHFRTFIYGTMDAPLCQRMVAEDAPLYQALARRLPRGAVWLTSPLSRTRLTAENIFAGGYPAAPLKVEPGLIEQDFGRWHGLTYAELTTQITLPAHAFWPIAAAERPPGGESMEDVLARMGPTMERLAGDFAGRDVVAVGHGGAIRMAVAHALETDAGAGLHFSVANLALTVLERQPQGWRVVTVNEVPQAA